MTLGTNAQPDSWLGFELNVLRRISFKSIAIPFAGESPLAANLKKLGFRVFANDPLASSAVICASSLDAPENSLVEQDLAVCLENSYVPRFELRNAALKNWFGEVDSIWFDNVRANIDKLTNETARNRAFAAVMAVGDYVFSFNEKTRRLRQPLNDVFRRYAVSPAGQNHGNGLCKNSPVAPFIAENYADVMFLRLPAVSSMNEKNRLGNNAWREEWLNGTGNVWKQIDERFSGKLGAPVASKAQYLQYLTDFLRTASHIGHWCISVSDGNGLTSTEVSDLVGSLRRVETVFSKDFSELTGARAVLILA